MTTTTTREQPIPVSTTNLEVPEVGHLLILNMTDKEGIADSLIKAWHEAWELIPSFTQTAIIADWSKCKLEHEQEQLSEIWIVEERGPRFFDGWNSEVGSYDSPFEIGLWSLAVNEWPDAKHKQIHCVLMLLSYIAGQTAFNGGEAVNGKNLICTDDLYECYEDADVVSYWLTGERTRRLKEAIELLDATISQCEKAKRTYLG